MNVSIKYCAQLRIPKVHHPEVRLYGNITKFYHPDQRLGKLIILLIIFTGE